jgi:hypothetical protein
MITKSGIHWLYEGIPQVQLRNGRIIELASRGGADDFVGAVGTDFFSTNLTAAYNEEDDDELATAYSIMRMAIDNASPEKMASGIPESELRYFLQHTLNTLKTLSTDRNWLRSGALSLSHELLLMVVAAFSKHIWFFKTFHSNEDMEAFAKFYASRKKNDTPNHKVAHLIVLIVNNALVYLMQEGLSHEKALGTMEKSGLLGQFIRCVPAHPEWSAQVVTSLQACLQLVKKKLKSGTRTGDILDAVVAGEDGPINEKAKASLARLQSLARLCNNNNNDRNNTENLKSCRRCDKIERQSDDVLLKKCQRCKATYYCSKECQKADWKSHKETCYEFSSGAVNRSEQKIADTTIGAVIELNYFGIAKEIYKKMQEYDVPKKELFLKIDFYGDAPALRNEVTVWLTSNFLKGASVPDVPDWFHTDAGRKDFAKYLRKQFDQVTSDHTLAVCRAANGVVNIRLVLSPVCDAFYKRLSDEAVVSIGTEDYVRMVACLGQTITNEYFEKRTGLG